jgi:hypothetical protein
MVLDLDPDNHHLSFTLWRVQQHGLISNSRRGASEWGRRRDSIARTGR